VRRVAPTIGIVDDDESIRNSISSLIRSIGYETAVFESAEAFLDSGRIHEIDCLIVDILMPGLNGVEVQRELANMEHSISIIFVSGHDGELRVKAIEQGAIAVLGKPFSEKVLLEAVYICVQSS
jgi:FixJ family two-component response regulator